MLIDFFLVHYFNKKVIYTYDNTIEYYFSKFNWKYVSGIKFNIYLKNKVYFYFDRKNIYRESICRELTCLLFSFLFFIINAVKLCNFEKLRRKIRFVAIFDFFPFIKIIQFHCFLR